MSRVRLFDIIGAVFELSSFRFILHRYTIPFIITGDNIQESYVYIRCIQKCMQPRGGYI